MLENVEGVVCVETQLLRSFCSTRYKYSKMRVRVHGLVGNTKALCMAVAALSRVAAVDLA